MGYTARVYVLQGINLRPVDYDNRSDPYCVVELGKTVLVDKDVAQYNQNAPVFGRYKHILFPIRSKNKLVTSFPIVGFRVAQSW